MPGIMNKVPSVPGYVKESSTSSDKAINSSGQKKIHRTIHDAEGYLTSKQTLYPRGDSGWGQDLDWLT